jgi:hypothetical protein
MPLHALFNLRKLPTWPIPRRRTCRIFLNKKRALSLEGLDRVMEAQGLTVEQILPVDLVAGAAEEEESSSTYLLRGVPETRYASYRC